MPLPPVTASAQTTKEGKENKRRRGRGYAGWKGKGIARDKEGRRKSDAAVSQDGDLVNLPFLDADQAELVRRYIVPVNGAICVILALWEFWQRRSWSEGVIVGGGFAPGLVLGVILYARKELRVLDLGELEGLRYRYQGA